MMNGCQVVETATGEGEETGGSDRVSFSVTAGLLRVCLTEGPKTLLLI